MAEYGWSYGDLPVITDQACYWSVAEISILYFIPPREIRVIIAEARIAPAGRRPNAGRGRAPLVFPAELLVDAFSVRAVA